MPRPVPQRVQGLDAEQRLGRPAGNNPERGTKGDCRAARAHPDENGQWHVRIRGKYVPVPRHAITVAKDCFGEAPLMIAQ
jgi:hypothetical protein